MATPELTNLVIPKGTDFEKTFYVFSDSNEPLIFPNGATGTATIAKYSTSPNKTPFTVGIATGQITIGMAKTMTAKLDSGRNYFNILIQISPTKLDEYIRGTIIVTDTIQ